VKRLLIFIVAYNAEKTIVSVLNRIPETITIQYDTTVLIIDDCSNDSTYEIARDYLALGFWCGTVVLRNPVNQGYGGNQKIGYNYAIANGYDLVALLHGDGQYAPESLPVLLDRFTKNDRPDAVFGSRMLHKFDALRGGMPLYKFVGNLILTKLQNLLLGSNLSEFHTGYRIYSVETLKKLPFHLNTDDFHFDTEIIVQLCFSKAKTIELPIVTCYGDEICHVNGVRYAWDVMKASIKARLIQLGIFYDPKFAVTELSEKNYLSKFEFYSTHSLAFNLILPNSVVLDLGCGNGFLSEKLHREKQCIVTSVDVPADKTIPGCTYISCDLNNALPEPAWEDLDAVLLLDVIEHLSNPEAFLEKLRAKLTGNLKVSVIVSAGNVCFFITRLMMFLGQFNYGRRGILDITHTRLFTVKSLQRLLRYASYQLLEKHYVPAPYPLAIGSNNLSKFMVATNDLLARILPGLFAYQAVYVIKPQPMVEWLLRQAIINAQKRY
jgi:glycosyltransferase involved in cell wall biosynthesis